MRLLSTALCAVLLSLGGAAYAELLPYNNTFVHVANNNGTRYDGDEVTYGAPDETYYVAFSGEGKGLNSLHVTTDLSDVIGQVNEVGTTTGSASGTFWITYTGGRGYEDDIILMIASSGPVPDGFQVNIASSGYNFAPGDYTNATYVTNALDEAFANGDFIYGPQTYRMSSLADYPFYYGQDTGDASTAMYFMFVDLYTGALAGSDGAVSVTYSFSGLDGNQVLAMDAYAWNGSAASGSGLNWTNPTSGSDASSYKITSAPAPVPIPAACYLFGSGLLSLGFLRRRLYALPGRLRGRDGSPN